MITGVYEKPRWEEGDRITKAQAVQILGALPVLQVDDWPDERIEDVAFLLVPSWTGHGWKVGS